MLCRWMEQNYARATKVLVVNGDLLCVKYCIGAEARTLLFRARGTTDHHCNFRVDQLAQSGKNGR